MLNTMKDISFTVEKPDKESQEDAMENSDLYEHFVAAAFLNESMPFDVKTSEFGEYHFFLKWGEWATLAIRLLLQSGTLQQLQ